MKAKYCPHCGLFRSKVVESKEGNARLLATLTGQPLMYCRALTIDEIDQILARLTEAAEIFAKAKGRLVHNENMEK